MQHDLTIVRATPDQIESIAAILEEGAALQRAKGFPGWPVPFPRQRLHERFAIGEVFLVYLDGNAIGTFSLQPSDPKIWGDQPDDALYLHGFATRDAVRGRGIGQAILRWAEARTREQGKFYLRLDTLGDDRALCRYYEQAGFVDRGTVEMGFCARLFEKRVGEDS